MPYGTGEVRLRHPGGTHERRGHRFWSGLPLWIQGSRGPVSYTHLIAGSYVLDGKITRGSKARITRDGEQSFEGPLASLKRFKDDVKEVNAGYECGLVFEGVNDLQEDDMIEVYIMVEVPR